jgi:hypothetical protein
MHMDIFNVLKGFLVMGYKMFAQALCLACKIKSWIDFIICINKKLSPP